MKKAWLIIAGGIFVILALIQFTRIYLQFPASSNNMPLPQWTSVAGLALTVLLSVWMFITAKRM